MFCMVNRHYVRRKEGERVKELETGLFMVDFCRDRASPFFKDQGGVLQQKTAQA